MTQIYGAAVPLTQPDRLEELLLVKFTVALNAPAAVGSTVTVKAWLPPGAIDAAVGLTVKLPFTGDAIVAFVMIRFCDPGAAVLRTVIVAVPVAAPAALGDAGFVVAHAGDGLTNPTGGAGITQALLGGLI